MAKRILLVDDEVDIVTTIKQVLIKEGYDVLTASNGKQALSILESEKFDLVLLDMFMPLMSGRDTAEAIRKNPKTKNQKIAFLTVAKLSEAGKGLIKKLKPVDYIQKPVDLNDFIKRINKVLSV